MALPPPLVAVLRELWADCETKFLNHGNGYKRLTQGLYLCSAVDLGREMPASPCPLAHRDCSVSDKYGTMMPDTFSAVAGSSIQALLCPSFTRLLRHVSIIWVCLETQAILLEWENTSKGCQASCWMLQSNWSSLQRYASDHTCTPINLVLEHWVCLSFECYHLREAELFDVVGGCASIELVHVQLWPLYFSPVGRSKLFFLFFFALVATQRSDWLNWWDHLLWLM